LDGVYQAVIATRVRVAPSVVNVGDVTVPWGMLLIQLLFGNPASTTGRVLPKTVTVVSAVTLPAESVAVRV
jgi:hypothetical protein